MIVSTSEIPKNAPTSAIDFLPGVEISFSPRVLPIYSLFLKREALFEAYPIDRRYYHNDRLYGNRFKTATIEKSNE
ncbi:hypothetical protein LEP1GSC168_0786 [Leptospira santarosai str. HAI134]|nr:hypothetical protein LEP1GSC168_0786 [Leptospira santarosai str. HAI134]